MTATPDPSEVTEAPGSSSNRPPPPEWVLDALARYRTAEMCTVTRLGGPSTFPVAIGFDPATKLLITTTSVAYPAKAENIARDPRVALFFGHAPAYSGAVGTGGGSGGDGVGGTGGGGDGSGGDTSAVPPRLLVRGKATVLDEDFDMNLARLGGFKPLAKAQPRAMRRRLKHEFWRRIHQCYLTRILINVEPSQVMVWRSGDCREVPEVFGWA